MSETSFKRLILRAVLRDVYPMVIRLVAVPDYLELDDFDDAFHAVLGWEGGIGTRSKFRARNSTAFAGEREPSECAILPFIAKRNFYTCWMNDLQNSPREHLTNGETSGKAVFLWRLEIYVQMR